MVISFLSDFEEADLAYNCGLVGYEAAMTPPPTPDTIHHYADELRGPMSFEILERLSARNAARVDAIKK